MTYESQMQGILVNRPKIIENAVRIFSSIYLLHFTQTRHLMLLQFSQSFLRIQQLCSLLSCPEDFKLSGSSLFKSSQSLFCELHTRSDQVSSFSFRNVKSNPSPFYRCETKPSKLFFPISKSKVEGILKRLIDAASSGSYLSPTISFYVEDCSSQ